MQKKIFFTRLFPSIAKETLKKRGFVVDEPDHDGALTQDELINAVEKYDGILSALSDKFTREVLQHAKHLSVISNYAIGLDNIDLDFAKSKKIAVCNTPDIVTHSTADLIFAIFLCLIRKIREANQYVLEGKWKAWDPYLFWGEELYGKTFGIIGFGRIGKEIAKRAKGFGLKVIVYHYRPLDIEPTFTEFVEQVAWETLLSKSDYLSLNVPLTEKTKGMIDYAAMKLMSKRPVIINGARGSVINTDDLVRALSEGLVRGAALDVTDPEPIAKDHPLCQMDQCLIVPHIGTSTMECRTAMARMAAENIISHFTV